MGSKWLNTLGLARRAGKVINGEKLLDCIKSKSVNLVIIASDCGESNKKKYSDKCKFYGIKYYIQGTKEEISVAIGKGNVSVVGIDDSSLAKLIENNMKAGD